MMPWCHLIFKEYFIVICLVWSNGLAKGYCDFLLCVFTCDIRGSMFSTYKQQLFHLPFVWSPTTCAAYTSTCIYVYVISYLYPLTLSVAKLYSCEANSTVVDVTVLTTNCLWHAHVMKPSVCTPVLLLDLFPAC